MSSDYEDFQGGSTPDPNEPGAGAANEDESTGKHALIFVPDFTNTSGTNGSGDGTPLNSYLRLGAAHSQAGPATTTTVNGIAPHGVRSDLGEDLAVLVTGFTDDTRNRGTSPTPGGTSEAPWPPEPPVGPAPPPGPADQYPLNESAILHTKGGWRDHSDGNRITTTRGDKIEVIRGNYKLLVLGRQDNVDNAAGFDNSGGFIDTDGNDLGYPGPGATNTGSDQQGLNMTWAWLNTDEDHVFRWHVTTIQGEENSSTNPTFLNQTFAHDVTSQTTANDINSTTTAKTMETTVTTDGDNVSSTTSNNGNLTNTTDAPNGSNTANTFGSSITLTTSAQNDVTQSVSGNTLTNNTNVLNIASDTTTLAQEAFSLALLDLELNLVGAQVAITAGEALLSGTFAFVTITEMANLMNITNWNGMVLDAHQGLHADNHAGMHIDNHSGIHLDLHTGAHMQQDTGVEIKSLTGTQLTNILGTSCHMLTQPISITETNQIDIAASYMRL